MKCSPFLIVAAATLLSIPFQGCRAKKADVELQRQTERARNVTIIRDDYGVPHIYGKTDADAVFGLLYAQSEDDFKRVERNYIWATGRLAEVEGEEALYSDLRARLYMTVEEGKMAYESAPPWLHELCVAFADGINYYLHTHPEVEPHLLTHFEPWMPMFFFEGSIGGDIEQIPLDRIEEFYGPRAVGAPDDEPAKVADHPTKEEPGLLAQLALDDEPRGSNGIAISGALTESGNAMLLITPHTTFYFRGEVHVASEEGLNAYGAVTWGQFFVYQGFNEHNGWMHTSTYVDFIDEFVETVSEQDGALVYRYGDELRPVEVSDVTLRYKEGDELLERVFPIYRTHHGPITHVLAPQESLPDGHWVATKINWDPVNALRQSYIRTKTTGHEEFREMMNIRANSSNNTVYADADGNIAYYHGNFVPKRDPSFDFSNPVDGSNPATDWQGRHTVDETITLLNPPNGWIQNANSTPFSAAGENSPRREDYPTYMAPDPENFRSIHAVRLLREASGLTLDGLIDLAYDPALPGFEVLVPGLVEAFDRSGSGYPELAGPIEELRAWDYTVAEDSVPMSLAHFYATLYNREGEYPEELPPVERFEFFATETPHEERLSLFKRVVDTLEADFGRWETPWGEINRYQRLSGAIDPIHDDDQPSIPVGMASGRWGALASYGARAFPSTRRIYGIGGNSFVAVVEFGEKVVAKSLLVGGQSGDPASPHFDDQAQRYVDRQFKEVAYYRDDVERRATRTYHPGE
jgi:acyl-homoserine-lactone acylase